MPVYSGLGEIRHTSSRNLKHKHLNLLQVSIIRIAIINNNLIVKKNRENKVL